MEHIVSAVREALERARLIEVVVSARHVHLTASDVEVLFGSGASLTPERILSPNGDFVAKERISVIGQKGKRERVAIIGPVGAATQLEFAATDCRELGMKAPLRASGDLDGSGAIMLEGPNGFLEVRQGAIVPKRHIHLTPEVAECMGLTDGQQVSVEILAERPLQLHDVRVRVNAGVRCRLHVDSDEANAAGVCGFTLGHIIA